MMRRKLPIGIQTFQKVRDEDCYYVDKTAYIQRLVDEGTHYFLSRPRRFGKSLFLDTLKELFEGNEALFAGLDIHRKWDWSVRHPVLRLSFGGGNFKASGFLQANFMEKLAAAEREARIANEGSTPAGRFAALLAALHREAGRPVVVLVDEYDKPILDALDAPDVARANREFLRGVYSVIKDCDAHVRFTFLTGVSRFSKVSLFSGLNNLIDITLDPAYSAICGCGGTRAEGRRDGAVAGQGLRGQVSGRGPSHPPDRRGVQQGFPQHRRVRGEAGVRATPALARRIAKDHAFAVRHLVVSA